MISPSLLRDWPPARRLPATSQDRVTAGASFLMRVFLFALARGRLGLARIERGEVGHVLVAQARGDRAHRRMPALAGLVSTQRAHDVRRVLPVESSARCRPTGKPFCSRECCGSRRTSSSWFCPRRHCRDVLQPAPTQTRAAKRRKASAAQREDRSCWKFSCRCAAVRVGVQRTMPRRAIIPKKARRALLASAAIADNALNAS